MGLFKSAVKHVTVAIQTASHSSYVAALVHSTMEQLQEVDEGIRAQASPAWHAARMTERMLLSRADAIHAQAQADSQVGDVSSVRRTIIETVRDTKMRLWEFDGTVNPFDLMGIQSRAGSLKAKVRTMFLIVDASTKISSSLFDELEDALFQDIHKRIP